MIANEITPYQTQNDIEVIELYVTVGPSTMSETHIV